MQKIEFHNIIYFFICVQRLPVLEIMESSGIIYDFLNSECIRKLIYESRIQVYNICKEQDRMTQQAAERLQNLVNCVCVAIITGYNACKDINRLDADIVQENYDLHRDKAICIFLNFINENRTGLYESLDVENKLFDIAKKCIANYPDIKYALSN